MAPSDRIKLYFLVKRYILEDYSKSDIREVATSRFGKIDNTEFDSAYSEAFTSVEI